MSDQPTVTNGPGWVVIQHENTHGYAEVTQEAFDDNHQHNGWRIVAKYGDAPAVAEAPAPEDPPSDPPVTDPPPPPPVVGARPGKEA